MQRMSRIEARGICKRERKRDETRLRVAKTRFISISLSGAAVIVIIIRATPRLFCFLDYVVI